MIECIEIERFHPRPDIIRHLAQEIRDGKLVACPTDTVYGIFVSMKQRKALERLTRLRLAMAGGTTTAQKLSEKPLSMVFANLPMVAEYLIITQKAYGLVKQLLPGPYTIILPAGRNIPKMMQNKRRRVGARIPDDLLVQTLIEELGMPVLSTTAKTPNGELIGDAISLSEAWPYDIDIVIDAGPFYPEPSTVLMVEYDGISLVREGKGPIDILEE